MDIGSIFLLLAILILVAVYISRPLMERRAHPNPLGRQDLSTLLAERDQVIAAVKELDDDYNLGKIPAEIYPSQRNSLLQRGVELLRQIDDQQNTAVLSTAEDRLEATIAAKHPAMAGASAAGRKNGNAVPPVPDDELEQKIASRRRQKEGKAGGFCPKCGRPIQANDRFCPKCGAPLN